MKKLSATELFKLWKSLKYFVNDNIINENNISYVIYLFIRIISDFMKVIKINVCVKENLKKRYPYGKKKL